MKKQIYICDPKIISKEIAQSVFDAEKYELHFADKKLETQDEIIANCKEADALIVTDCDVTQKVVDSLPNLKYVSGAIIGFNTIDLEATKKAGIAVSNNPRYCTNEVADHTCALIMTLNRHILQLNKEVQTEYKWSRGQTIPAINVRRLNTQILGLFGFGAIAKAVAKRMQAFGLTVIAYDPYVTKEQAAPLNVEMVDIPELCKRANVISIHMPHMASTDKMINKSLFDMMEQKPIIVNCARGGVINEEDLAKALDEGKVMAAGLDVVSDERAPIQESPFIGRDNVIITPHAAYYSYDARIEMQELGCKHIVWFFEGQKDKCPIVNGVK
ncbi:MAG: C-terminal binding protein [Eubacteriaceae bacterium]